MDAASLCSAFSILCRHSARSSSARRVGRQVSANTEAKATGASSLLVSITKPRSILFLRSSRDYLINEEPSEVAHNLYAVRADTAFMQNIPPSCRYESLPTAFSSGLYIVFF